MSEYDHYFVRSGSCPQPAFACEPADALRPVVCLDESVVPGAFFGSVQWIAKDLTTTGLLVHDSDELHMFVGGDPACHEELGATIDFQLENDHLVFSETSFVFVPAGCAHNIVSVSGLKRPLLHYVMHVSAGRYRARPGTASAAPGAYANYRVIRYERADGVIPGAPEGFLTFLLWIDGQKLPRAPYTEAVWFHTVNDTGPEEHVHDDLDEFVAFIGSDPEHPEALNGDISLFVGGETIHTDRSTLAFVPRLVPHSPILVHALERDVLHFTGGNSGNYRKEQR